MFRSSFVAITLIFGGFSAFPVAAQTVPALRSSIEQTNLTVFVSGLRNVKGQVLIRVWNGPAGFPKQSDKSIKYAAIDSGKAVNGTVVTTFNLPPGNYAVTALHDENKNGKMDTNFVGIPTEGHGASNNPVARFGPPSFEQTSFKVPGATEKISILIRY